MVLSEEIEMLKLIKEKSLQGIDSFLSIPAERGTNIINPLVYKELYEFAENAISKIPKKEKTPTYKRILYEQDK
jgi:hypothetical protein